MLKVGIIGANGYTGLELMKILGLHNKAQLTLAVSRSNVGVKIKDIYAPLEKFYGDMTFSDADTDVAAKMCDVVFTALPHAASAGYGGKLFDSGVKVIDLSADFRYDDLKLYEHTYKVTHPRPELNRIAVYGMTELNRDKIRTAAIVGNPGCYTTCSIMPLKPLIEENLIDINGIIIDAKSGITGAGRKSDIAYSYSEAADNFKAYGVTTHRHTTEIEEHLSGKRGAVSLSFTPHLLPVKRGILSTIYCGFNNSIDDVAAAYHKYYGKENFVKVLPYGKLPELRDVVGSNDIHIGYVYDKKNSRLIIVSALDNLLKGASGQAVQNMNVMFGFDESEGINNAARYL